MLITDIHCLTDDELVARIATLNGAAKEATAALVAHLAELESRDLHLALGFPSLYGYCRAVLRLSEHESYNRMEAAHVVRRLPVVAAMLAEGLLHLTAVRLLAAHLEDEDHLALLGGAIHKSKVEVKELLAARFPKADVATSIRRTPTAAGADGRLGAGAKGSGADIAGPGAGEPSLFSAAPAAENGLENKGAAKDEGTDENPALASVPSGPRGRMSRKATIDPLSAETYSLRMTARRATIERLRRAQEILSHAVPDGDVDEVLYRVLGAFIEREGRSTTDAPARRTRPKGRPARSIDPTSRTIRAEVERAVRRRDRDRCAFVARDGRRCEERRFLELHHLKPWIAGGEQSPRNIALRCRAHNQYEWRAFVAPIRKAQEVPAIR